MNQFLWLFCIILILPTRSVVTAQQDLPLLTGIWQADDSTIGTAWLDNYQFYPNGNFQYNFDEYDGSKRILRLEGKYRVDNRLLITTISVQTEIVGGRIVRGGFGSESEWVLFGGKKRVIRLRPAQIDSATIQPSSSQNCVLIHGRKYFQIEKDPNKY